MYLHVFETRMQILGVNLANFFDNPYVTSSAKIFMKASHIANYLVVFTLYLSHLPICFPVLCEAIWWGAFKEFTP